MHKQLFDCAYAKSVIGRDLCRMDQRQIKLNFRSHRAICLPLNTHCLFEDRDGERKVTSGEREQIPYASFHILRTYHGIVDYNFI